MQNAKGKSQNAKCHRRRILTFVFYILHFAFLSLPLALKLEIFTCHARPPVASSPCRLPQVLLPVRASHTASCLLPCQQEGNAKCKTQKVKVKTQNATVGAF